MARSLTKTSGSLHRSPVRNLLRVIGWILAVLILLVITGWDTLAVYYSNLPEPLRLPEEVYVYRAYHGTIEDSRRLFLEYMTEINSLKTAPEFHNSLTTNCTSIIWLNTRVNPDHLPFIWKILRLCPGIPL